MVLITGIDDANNVLGKRVNRTDLGFNAEPKPNEEMKEDEDLRVAKFVRATYLILKNCEAFKPGM